MTMQMKDRLIHKEANQAIVSGSPLFDLLKDRELLEALGNGLVVFDSSNRRGFTCEWTIIDGELYLTKFRSRSMRLYKTAQIFGTEPIYDLDKEGKNIHSFYPDDTTQVKADWFSGIIVAYDQQAQNKKDLNGWEYTFQEGKLIDEKRKYVLIPGYKLAMKLKKYMDD
ncbi:MAG: hypothetical protein JHC35_05425 [Sulfuricurvum sp.]|jgi:hypothetical protein|uniref:hypothetical protein n=1 Tax=Sulfuricurvum sp. TaxID=2025608 RepID=UPI0025CF81BD|nr:hypothetical protein [Sulfuricurvum sp.]MCI4406717.1 hypothetical protein [Sulfuricurvum sp.]